MIFYGYSCGARRRDRFRRSPHGTACRAGILAGRQWRRADAPLAVGQTLVVRHPRELHTVTSGESVYSIALRYGLSVRTLYQNNPALGGRSALYPGRRSSSPTTTHPCAHSPSTPTATPLSAAACSTPALPYLTYSRPLPTASTPTARCCRLRTKWLLAAAGQYRTAALMHLSTLTEEGRFDNARSTLILEDADAQDALVQSILETVQARHYFGLDVDFEYVLPEQREAYAAFITRLREALNPLGCPVIVALAPKTSAAQRGLLYEAQRLRAPRRGSQRGVPDGPMSGATPYGPPDGGRAAGAGARRAGLCPDRVAPEKIFMGIPLYGYDWPLPFVSGETRAESLSPVQAVERALRHDIAIQYDAAAQAPYYHYTDRGGREHAVWFEDARSIEAKLRLADEYHCRAWGTGILHVPFPRTGWCSPRSLILRRFSKRASRWPLPPRLPHPAPSRRKGACRPRS